MNLLLALVSALLLSKPTVHVRTDWGIPDSLALSLQVEDTCFIEAGLLTDLGGWGLKVGLGVYTPAWKGFRFDFRADSGYVWDGDVTHVAKLVTGNDALSFDLLTHVNYSFTSLSTSLNWAYDHFEVFARVGWSWLASAPTDLGSDLRDLVGIDITSHNAHFGYYGLTLRVGMGLYW